MSDPVTEAVERLTRFAVDGVSGNTVYESGIFGLTGPNTFYSDLRTVLFALSTAQRERDEAREALDSLLGAVEAHRFARQYNDGSSSSALDILHSNDGVTVALARARKALEQAP